MTLEQNLDETKIAWLAGLLEGEGCFSLALSNKIYLYPKIELQMNDEDIVNRVASMIGGKVYLNKYKQKQHHKDVFRTYIMNSKACKVMELVYPYMGSRRQNKILSILHSHNEYDKRFNT